MVARVLALGDSARQALQLPAGAPLRLAALAAVLSVLLAQEGVREILLQVLADAYLQVSVFVAATFAVFQAMRHVTGRDIGQLLEQLRPW